MRHHETGARPGYSPYPQLAPSSVVEFTRSENFDCDQNKCYE
jgi:hypothetical protein